MRVDYKASHISGLFFYGFRVIIVIYHYLREISRRVSIYFVIIANAVPKFAIFHFQFAIIIAVRSTLNSSFLTPNS